jgi:DinB superfamily
MDDRALIQHQLATSHQIVKQCLGDITQPEANRLPEDVLAPIVWQVGHLAVANRNFIERAGVTPAAELPERYGALFKTGTGGAADYPPLSEVVQAFDQTHEALTRALMEARLETPIEVPPGRPRVFTNIGEMFSFADAHRWYHIGKITSLRALLGKPRLFG